MIKTPIHVIDFEGCRTSGIVEFGVVTMVGDHVQSTRTAVCAPIGVISELDRRQHGIGEAVARSHAAFDRYWSFFTELRQTGLLCAHNQAVEDGLLRSVWPYPVASPDYVTNGPAVADWGPWLDTLHIYRAIYPQLEQYKLSFLVDSFGLADELGSLAAKYCPEGRQKYHCALYDALASALLLGRLYGVTELEGLTLHWLYQNSQPSLNARNRAQQQDLFE